MSQQPELKRDGHTLWEKPQGSDTWLRVADVRAQVVVGLASLGDEERAAIFGLFCVHCGADCPRCTCMRDD